MGDMAEGFNEMKRGSKAHRSKKLESADDTGWSKHTPYHWYRDLNGSKLNYWPSKGKWQYKGKVMTGDVNNYISKCKDPRIGQIANKENNWLGLGGGMSNPKRIVEMKTCFECEKVCLELSYNSRCMDCMNKRDIDNQKCVNKGTETRELPRVLGNMFRSLEADEVDEFKAWAIDNYTPSTEISDIWHPVVREECEKINKEFYSQVKSRD